jgi:ubiquinone/menaquinone biosynthesis C-methylase UbiE
MTAPMTPSGPTPTPGEPRRGGEVGGAGAPPAADAGPVGSGPTTRLPVSRARTSLAAELTLRISRKLWRGRAESWAGEGSVGLRRVVDTVVLRARPPARVVVDLGCGSGQVTFPLASSCGQVLAVDIDAGAIDLLARTAAERGLGNIEGVVAPLETLELPHGSVDLIVSNYAMHHLRDADKRTVMTRSYQWLAPGGRLVIGDMMFGRGLAAEDRQIVRQKVSAMIGRGPAGWWRILKNAGRFLLRFQEKPLRTTAWVAMLESIGFENVEVEHVLAEAHVISATRPA